MPAYLIADVTRIRDAESYARYVALVPATLAQYGGAYLARGGTVHVLEGNWRPSRLVLVRFDSSRDALHWWNSSEYEAPKKMRQTAAETNLIVVEGM